jgi:hypothetical protein
VRAYNTEKLNNPEVEVILKQAPETEDWVNHMDAVRHILCKMANVDFEKYVQHETEPLERLVTVFFVFAFCARIKLKINLFIGKIGAQN